MDSRALRLLRRACTDRGGWEWGEGWLVSCRRVRTASSAAWLSLAARQVDAAVLERKATLNHNVAVSHYRHLKCTTR